MKTELAALLSLVASSMLAGCIGTGPGETSCTLMACEDGVTIDFAGGGATAQGKYDFDIVADGQKITCTATLPLPPCASVMTSCSAAGVGLIESGCALPPAQHSLAGLTFTGVHPTSIAVTVKRDGAQIAMHSFTLAYQRVAPNGEECGPVCEQAPTQNLAIP